MKLAVLFAIELFFIVLLIGILTAKLTHAAFDAGLAMMLAAAVLVWVFPPTKKL